MAKVTRFGGRTTLSWFGDFVGDVAEQIALNVMKEKMRQVKTDALLRLYLNHGVATGTMKARVHVAPGCYNWSADHLEPQENAPALHDDYTPRKMRGKWALEIGSGQKYALSYHQNYDPFLRIPFEQHMRGFKSEVGRQWRATFQ